MMARCAFFFLPILALAQPGQAPPEVEKELRARVNGFYQNLVDGSFRKAEAFVAEDTKDLFYSQGKEKFSSYRIEKITFFDDFKKASVMVIGTTQSQIAGQRVTLEKPADTRWKIEDGKWCWYYHREDFPLTPMGGANPPAATGPVGAPPPKDFSPEAIEKAGRALLAAQPMGIDRRMVALDPTSVSTEKVVFTNGSDGYVQIGLNGPLVRGLTWKFDRMMIPAHETAVLTLHFDPSDKSGPIDAYIPKGSISFKVTTAPIERLFPLTLTFQAK